MDTLGLYFHIPFCKGKCPYCDFYSVTDKSLFEPYKDALCDEIRTKSRCKSLLADDIQNKPVDTVYFGGGTPSYWGADNVCAVLQTAKTHFAIAKDAEITVECNPSSPDLEAFLSHCAENGVNRVSLGMQSAVDSERKGLGRTADAAKVLCAVHAAKKAGIHNISLDLMIGIPNQTKESLQESLQFLIDTGVPHASVYMLSIEEGTFFHKNAHRLNLPDDDTTAQFYLQTVDFLNRNGLSQYEISNFARPGFESRHNSRYWEQEEYLGLGAAAHSFVNGKRFAFSRSVSDFLQKKEPQLLDCGGDNAEYVLLQLRMNKGLSYVRYRQKFGKDLAQSVLLRAEKYAKHGLLITDKDGLRLTADGFLVSNTILCDLLDALDDEETI